MYGPSLPGGRSLHAGWFSGLDDVLRDECLDGCTRAGRDCHAHLLGPKRKTFY